MGTTVFPSWSNRRLFRRPPTSVKRPRQANTRAALPFMAIDGFDIKGTVHSRNLPEESARKKITPKDEILTHPKQGVSTRLRPYTDGNHYPLLKCITVRCAIHYDGGESGKGREAGSMEHDHLQWFPPGL